MKPRKGNQFRKNVLFYNPRGLWYSYNNSWMEHNKLDLMDKFLYKVNIDKINIKKLKSVSDLDNFIKKYYNSISIIDWNKVYNDYDGLQIYPFFPNNMKYGKIFTQIHTNLSFDDKIIIHKIFNNKLTIIPKHIPLIIKDFLQKVINGKINKKYLYRIWCIGWEVGSGVIWKNYSKLDLEEILLNIN